VATPNTHAVRFDRAGVRQLFAADLGASTLDVDRMMTFEVWFKLGSLPADGDTYAFVVKSDFTSPGTQSYGFELRNESGTQRVIARFEGTRSGGGNAVDRMAFDWPGLAVGEWHHLAVSYDLGPATVPERFRFYRDGAPAPPGDIVDLSAGEPIALVRDTTVDMMVGVRVTGGATENGFDGLLDELRVWGVVRAPADIAASYLTELTGNEAGLRGYWQLDDNALDSGPNGIDLGIIGGFNSVTDTPF
jgi:hypothetical protein